MQCFVVDCGHLLQERILQMYDKYRERKKDFEAPRKMDETSDLFCTTLLMMCDSLKPALLLLHLVVLRPFLSAIEQSYQTAE